MKKILAFLTAASMLAAVTSCGSKKTESGDTGTYVYGQIDSISGNDIVLNLADYNEKSADDGEAENQNREAAEGDSESKGEKPEGGGNFGGFGGGNFDPENMPSGFDKDSMPEGFSKGEKPSSMPSGMPEGFSGGNFDPESMPSGFDKDNIPEGFSKGEKPSSVPSGFNKDSIPEGFSGGKGGSRSGSSSYTLTGDQTEIRIQSGAVVTTKLGVETTFSVLKSGDVIKCSVAVDSDGNEIITAVWIME